MGREHAWARAGGARPLAAGLGLLACTSACTDPTVDAVAVWLEAPDGEGATKLAIYERGDRWGIPVEPDVPGVSPQFVALGLDARGQTVAVASDDRVSVVDLHTRRRVSFSAASLGVGELAASFSYTRSQDALLREVEYAVPRTLAVVPLFGEHALEPSLLAPEAPASTGTQWAVRTCADAPMLFWFEHDEHVARVRGAVEAVQLPGLPGAGLPPIERPVRRASVTMLGASLPNRTNLRVSSTWCSFGLCAAPDGRSIVTLSSAPCEVQRWTWTAVEDAPVETIALSSRCVADREPQLLAQLAHDVVVLEDDNRIYWTDLGTKAWRALSKPSSPGGRMTIAERGRAAVIVWPKGEVMRIDASGPRLVNVEQTGCLSENVETRVSPNGHWVLQTCTGIDSIHQLDAPVYIVRISAFGLEQHFGIAMRPLAIDDAGDALLYSYEPADGQPRGLYVLSADGQLARVDQLEPEPVVVFNGNVAPTWFGAAALEG